jgi:hypothetical protein
MDMDNLKRIIQGNIIMSTKLNTIYETKGINYYLNFPFLKSLNLYNCKNLKLIDITADLDYLNLQDCNQLNTIMLNFIAHDHQLRVQFN